MGLQGDVATRTTSCPKVPPSKKRHPHDLVVGSGVLSVNLDAYVVSCVMPRFPRVAMSPKPPESHLLAIFG